MKYTRPELLVLRHGIASRLRLSPDALRVDYADSTYQGAPAGIRDDSACVRAFWKTHPRQYSAVIRASILDGADISDAANKFASLLTEADSQAR